MSSEAKTQEASGGYTADSTITKPVGGSPHEIGVFPLDEHNAYLLNNIAPRNWTNPTRDADFVYDFVAVGAGAGGLVSSESATHRGFSAALLEKHMSGGDCLNVGCVPSKAVIRCARAIREVRISPSMGVKLNGEVGVDFPVIMKRLRELRAEISDVDSFSGAQKGGIDMYQGEGKFTGPNTIEVGGQTLRFKKAAVCSGGSAACPPIKGLAGTPYHTNASIFNLTECPKKMMCVGAGPIGCELAQSFAMFGADVTVAASAFMPREDRDAAIIVQKAMEADGVKFALGGHVTSVSHNGSTFSVTTTSPDSCIESVHEDIDCLLMAAGRKPNVEGLNLEAAGIEYDHRSGVHIDDFCQTTNPNVYAIGDCCSKYQFTHMSARMAEMVIDNAFFGQKRALSALLVPWATYTEPEIAHVGAYEHEVEGGVDTYTSKFEENDRAILEGTKEGFAKIHCAKGTEKIVGCTIVGAVAGELLNELTVCVQFGLTMTQLSQVIHPYPTQAEIIAQAVGSWKRAQWKNKAAAIAAGTYKP